MWIKRLIIAIVIVVIVGILYIFPAFRLSKYENILTAKVQPINGENVFFIDTMEKSVDVTLKARQACAIESAALMNPHLKIFVLFASHERVKNLQMTPELEAVLSYENVLINYLDIEEFAKGSPMNDFIESKKLSTSKYKVEHTSDVLRLLILWKYGGTYLDTDMIVKQNLTLVPSNFACLQDSFFVNGAILNFDNGAGKNISKLFIDVLIDRFNGFFFASNGPLMITSILKNLCKVDNVTLMTSKNDCEGFHVFDADYCYPIPYYYWKHFFLDNDADLVKKVMNQTSNSIVVHFWNNLSHGKLISVSSDAPYMQLARKFCPRTVKNIGDFL